LNPTIRRGSFGHGISWVVLMFMVRGERDPSGLEQTRNLKNIEYIPSLEGKQFIQLMIVYIYICIEHTSLYVTF
jgi:hypothetical protein